MNTTNQTTDQPEGQELVIERVFDSSPEAIWQAWSDPQQFKRWWGPRTFTTPLSEIDFRVGGKYLYCMHGPDIQDTYGTGVFREIVKHQRIVFTDAFADPQGNPVPASAYDMGDNFPDEMLVIVTLEDLGGGKTRQTLQHLGLPAGEVTEMSGTGWNESFEKLAELLQSGK